MRHVFSQIPENISNEIVLLLIAISEKWLDVQQLYYLLTRRIALLPVTKVEKFTGLVCDITAYSCYIYLLICLLAQVILLFWKTDHKVNMHFYN